jgi:hypothetical protein
MNWLYEQPILIVMIGIGAILALGAAWSTSGRKELLYAIGGVVLLMIAGLVTERIVVTDKEAIRATLAQIAHDVQTNDRKAVVRHVHSSTPELKQKAEAELPNYKFTECRITRIHTIDVDAKTEPRSAMVEFNVIATGSFSHGGLSADGSFPRRVKLHMLREKDGRWTVAEYEHDDPQRMIMNGPQ